MTGFCGWFWQDHHECGTPVYNTCTQNQYETRAPSLIKEQRSYSCGPSDAPRTCTKTITPGCNDRLCSTVSNCNAGTRVTKPHTSTTNRQCGTCAVGTFTDKPNQGTCSPHTTCNKAEYISSAVFENADRICSVCPDSTYQNGTNHQETECKKQITCGVGERFVDGGSKTEEGSCEACEDGTFQNMETHRDQCRVHNVCDIAKGQSTAVDPTPTSDRICATSEGCTEYQYESQALTPSTQRLCGYRTTCSNGEYVIADPTPTSDRSCADCDGEVEYSNRTNSARCTVLATCAKGEFVAVPGSRTKPLVCKEWQGDSGNHCPGTDQTLASNSHAAPKVKGCFVLTPPSKGIVQCAMQDSTLKMTTTATQIAGSNRIATKMNTLLMQASHLKESAQYVLQELSNTNRTLGHQNARRLCTFSTTPVPTPTLTHC